MSTTTSNIDMGIAEKKVVSIGGFDIPEHIIGKILEYCDLKEIVTLGKLSKGFRQAIGFLRPDLHITVFDFHLDSTKIVCKMNSGTDLIEVQYKKHRKGCMVKRVGSPNENFVNRNYELAFSMDNFGFFCFQTSPVEFFRLHFQFYDEDEKNREVEHLANEFINHSIYGLQRRQTPFQAHHFSMNFTDDLQVAKFFVYFDPSALQKLELHKRYLPLFEKIWNTRIPKMLQWKQVKEVDIGDSVYDGLVADLVHIDKGRIRMEEITLQGLVELKDAFLASPTFESFELQLIFFNESQFLEVFGPPLSFSDDIKGKWLFQNQKTEQLLSISLSSSGNSITFYRENWKEVVESFSSDSTMKYILDEVETGVRDILRNKSMLMMNMKQSFKNKLQNVHIYINVNNATLSFELNTNPGINRSFFYQDHEDGCMSVFNKDKKLMEDQDFVTILMKDLELIFKYQTDTIPHLKLFFHAENTAGINNRTDEEFVSNKFLNSFRLLLSSRRDKTQVTAFYMNPNSQEQLLAVLPFLKPGYLQTIALEHKIHHKSLTPSFEALRSDFLKLPVHVQSQFANATTSEQLLSNTPSLPPKFFERVKSASLNEKLYLDIDKIVKLPQWKEAKIVFMENLVIATPVYNLVNFLLAKVTLQTISVDDLETLETILQSSPISLEIGYIHFTIKDQNDSTSMSRPYETFGKPNSVYKDSEKRINKVWYFPIEGTDLDVVIRFRSDKTFAFCRSKTEFRRPAEEKDNDWTGLVLFSNVYPEVMEKILEKVDFRSILVLRKVSVDLRNFIDDTRIKHPPRKISISVNHNSIEIYFGYIGDLYHFYYKGDEFGCTLLREKSDEEKRNSRNQFDIYEIEDVNYFSVFFKDLGIILGHPRSILDELSIEFPCFLEEEQEIGDRMLCMFRQYLESRYHKLSVEKLSIKAVQQSGIMDILPYINPKSLKKLELINQKEEEERLVVYEISKLDQWRNTKELVLKGFVISLAVERLLHFSKVTCCVDTIAVPDLMNLKEACLQSPKEFSLECKVFDTEDLYDIFGRPLLETSPEGQKTRKWFYKIPKNSETVLQLIIDASPSVKVSRIPASSVPQNGKYSD